MINTVINKTEQKTQRGSLYMRPSTWTAIQKILKVQIKYIKKVQKHCIESVDDN